VAFDTYLLDDWIAEHRTKLEQERQTTFTQVIQWLEEFGDGYGIYQAYVFGSLVYPGKFTENSDVDVAIGEVAPEDFFDIISLLSTALSREVDLLEIKKCHFAHRIRQQGVLWKKDI
jgi:uncharacterized protein